MALGKKTGGRTAGTPNKKLARIEAAIAEAGITPLEYMLQVLKNPDNDPKDRQWAAQAAAPYVHAKLASVEVGNKAGETFRVALLNEDGGLL